MLSINVYAVQPEDFGLIEGDLIGAYEYGDPDIYIVNKTQVRSYKRIIINPTILSYYGHLGGFNNIKSVTPDQLDAFPVSGFFRLNGDNKVWCLEVANEDYGILHHISGTDIQSLADDPDFFLKIFYT